MSKSETHNNDSQEIRFLIPSRAAGAIIGKGGENIKDIRERLDIRVSIPDSSGPERSVILQGQSPSLIEALEIILNKSISYMPASESDLYNERGGGRRRFKSREDSDSTNEADAGIDFRLLIHQSQAGGIIGRGGERIKELRETATIKTLKVYQSTCPRSCDRVVQIVGSVGAVLICVEKILDIVSALGATSGIVIGPEEQYNPRNFVEAQVLSYGGWLSKAGMRTLEEMGPAGLLNIMPETSAAAAALAVRGGPAAVAGMLGRVAPRSFLEGVGVVKTVQFSVPNAYMGAIMGRGGNKIRAIREESQAEIRVYEPDKNGGDRIIDITGTDSQIAFAQQLLKNSVKRQ